MQTTIHAAIAAMLVAAGCAVPPALMAIETLAPAEAPARWADLSRGV